MSTPALLPCDGCGQLADSAHISRRLQRLAWATRFRPLHIQALLLCGIVPAHDSEFFYNPSSSFQSEAATILKAIQISTEGKTVETVLAEFQKLGLMLTHILECPLEPATSAAEAHTLLEKQLPFTIARIRRSLKPKGLLLISSDLRPVAAILHQAHIDCPVLPHSPGVFFSAPTPTDFDLLALRQALAVPKASAL